MANRSDDFNIAGALVMPSGGGPSYALTGSWSSDGTVASLASNVDGVALLDAIAPSLNLQANLPTIATDIGFCFRSNSARTSALIVSISKGGGYAKLMKRTGGNATFGNEFGAGVTGITWTDGDTLKVTDLGASVTVYRNGTQVAQWTDNGSNGLAAYNVANTYAGLFSYGTGTGTFDNLSIAGVASMAASRANVLTGASGTTTVTLTGSGTAWTAGTPGSPTFSLGSAPTGWSIASQVVNSATSATITLNRGTGTGAFTVSDGSLSASLTATVTATAVATGNASSAATWDVAAVPGAGNKVAIPTGFTVTVDSGLTIGTSPSDTTTNVLTGTGTGSLMIADGVTFAVKGNVAIDNGVLQVGTGATGGAILEFDSSAATLAGITAPTPTASVLGTALGNWTAGTYYYKVTALTANGESTPSGEVSAVVTTAHQGVALSWAPVVQATGYKVYRSTSSGGQGSSPALVATVNTFVDLTGKTAYLDTGAATTSGSVPGSNTATAGVQYQCVIGGNGKTASKFKVRGTTANRAVVRSNAGGGNAQVVVTDGVHDLADARFTRMGATGSDALTANITSATAGTHALARVVLDADCGQVHVASGLPVGVGFTLDYVTHKSLATNLTMSGATNPPTGPRRIKGCVFLGLARFAPEGMAVGSSAAGDETLFLGSFPSPTSFSGRATYANALVRHTADPSTTYEPLSGWRMGDWDDVAIVCDASDYDGNGRYAAKRSSRNAHWTTPASGPNGTYAVTNSLCESFGMDSDDRTLDASDGDFDYGPTAGANSAFYKFLMIPQDRDSSSVPSSPACTATNMAGTGSTYDHCTCYNGQQGFIALCESSDGTAGQIASCKSNLVWDEASQSSGAFNAILYIDNPTYAGNLATFPTDDVVASGAADYNCFFNGNTARNYAGAPGYYYKRSAGATVPGAHDLVGVDPQFTDKTVRFWRWVRSLIGSNVIPAPASGGSPLTVADDTKMGGQTAGNASPPATGWRDYCAWGLYKLSLKNEPTHADYDPRFTLAAYKAFVRAGFTPRNPLLKNAGHDGVTIGAFDLPPVNLAAIYHFRRRRTG